MATRSRIAIENEDGTVTSVYCHNNGYVEGGNGETLIMHYRDREKVKQLIALGNLSSVSARVKPKGTIHSFNTPEPGVTVAYHRDRGEDFDQSQHKSVPDFFDGDIEEFGYLFTQEGEWLVKSGYSDASDPVPVTYVLSRLAEL
jgi:hypothetical protein